MDDITHRSQFRIGDLLVIPARLVVVRDGQEIKLEKRWMQVLVMLAEHAGETLSTERLLIEVWGSTVYGDSPVSKTISCIRKSIGDDSRKPRYIETVSKAGYRLIAPVSLPEDYRRMPSEQWTAGNPYVGLSAFDADHASVFCGRSRIVADLLRAMRVQIDNQRRFVLIVGASGCGKTSLLRAGAIPLLTKPDGFDGLRALAVSTCDLAANGRDPLIPLTAALATWTLGDRQVFPPQMPEQLKILLTETPEMIEGFVSEAFRHHSKRDPAEQPYAHLLLTVDHAEALVATTDIDTDARDAFARVLQALCACPHVMVTMIARGDFYLKLIEALPTLAEFKAGDGHLDVMAPRYGEIGEIIRSPAWKADLSFETDPVTRTRLDDALRDAALSQPDALPLLQHTLQTLYERRNDQRQLTFAAYNDIGGLEGAIAHRAEEVFAALPTQVQKSLDAVLARIIVFQSDSDVISARRTDTHTFDPNAQALVKAFIDARLFVSGLHKGHPSVGVVHEALLRRWPRALEWTDDNQRLLMAKARFQRAAERWDDEGRQDDHLISRGRPLGEAQEVAQRFPSEFDKVMSAFLYASEKSSLRSRRIRAFAMTTLAILTLVSTTLAIIALQARNTAEKHERESRRLTYFMLGDLADELRRRGMLHELGKIGTEAIDYLEDRNLENLGPIEMTRTARAYRTVGEALISTQSPDEARTSFKQAYALANLVLVSDQNDQNAIFERGNASYWLGQLDYDKKRYVNAMRHWRDYDTDSRQLIALNPEKVEWIIEKSYSEHNLGAAYLRQGDTERAMHHFRESLVAKEKLIKLKPNVLDYQVDQIESRSWIASTWEASGNLSETSSEYDHQISMLTELIDKNKSANRWRSRLANYMMLSAILETGLGNLKKADTRALEAIRILEQLVEFSPDNDEWTRDLAKARLILAESSTLRSDRATAEVMLSRILETASELDKDTRDSLPWRWIDARARFAASMLDKDAAPNARTDQAVADLASLVKESDSDDIQESFAYALLLRGEAQMSHGRSEQAIRDWNTAIASIEKTSWKRHPLRNWIWSKSKLELGDSNSATSTFQWLKDIGYTRNETTAVPTRYRTASETVNRAK